MLVFKIIVTFWALITSTLASPSHLHRHHAHHSHSHLSRRSTSTYTVASGDTGSSISAKYSITFNTLSSFNPSVVWTSLQVGQGLVMPSQRVPIAYHVVSGDTGNAIASKYNIVFDDFSAANPSVNWNNLQIGQILSVPGYGTATTYYVVSGDTGTTIAASFEITFSSLSAVNSGVNWNALQIGQVLQVPVGGSPSQASTPMPSPTTTTVVSTTTTTSSSLLTSKLTTTTTTTKTATTSSSTSQASSSTSKTSSALSTSSPSSTVLPTKTSTSLSSSSSRSQTTSSTILSTTVTTQSSATSTTKPAPSSSSLSTTTSPKSSISTTISSYSSGTSSNQVSSISTTSTASNTSPSSSTSLSTSKPTTKTTTTTTPTKKTTTATKKTSSSTKLSSTTSASTLSSSKQSTTLSTSFTSSPSTSFTSSSTPTTTMITTTSVTTTSTEPAVTNTGNVVGPNAVTSINNYDGVGPLPDSYTFYSGNGSAAAGWPAITSWISFSDMWKANLPYVGTSCSFSSGSVAPNSATEQQQIYDAIQAVAAKSYLDHRLLLAVIMQESSGCVRVPTTVGSHENPGLMQSYQGAGSCNFNTGNGTILNPCPVGQIFQMIEDGSFGTATGDGFVQGLNYGAGGGGFVGSQAFYRAARYYNSGSVPADGDLGGPGATRCYSSDIANRLMGWITAQSSCHLDGN